jgi:hypothetical protein
VARVEACHLLGIEARQRFAVGLPLAQDRDPAEAGLRALENQELEEGPVVVDRHAPLVVVVADVEGIASTPATASHGARHGGTIESIASRCHTGPPARIYDRMVMRAARTMCFVVVLASCVSLQAASDSRSSGAAVARPARSSAAVEQDVVSA